MMATVADRGGVGNGLVLAVLIIYRQPPVRGVRRLIRSDLLAVGCAELGLAAYMLPRSAISTLETLASRVTEEGGSASVCELHVSGAEECQLARRFFDRSAAYAAWLKNADRFQSHVHLLTGTQVAHSLKQLRKELDRIGRRDFFPSHPKVQCEGYMADLTERHSGKGLRDDCIPMLFEGRAPQRSGLEQRVWVTSTEVDLDSLACEWLVRRKIDPGCQVVRRDQKNAGDAKAITFGFDGAQFVRSERQTCFDLLTAAYLKHLTPGVTKIGRLIHAIDRKGIALPEASGVAVVMSVMRKGAAENAQYVASVMNLFDAISFEPASIFD